MNFTEMNTEELLAKSAEIRSAIEAEEGLEELRALDSDRKAVDAELEARKAAESEKAEIRAAVAAGAGEVTETIPEERKENKMSEIEIRNSAEYINAYAEYIKSGDDTECRALLSENATGGTVAVPELVYDIVKTAWEKEGIMSRVRKSFLKGNLKVGFEISATGAVKHNEGVAVDEETLVLGIVNLVPSSVKKWVSISDEALDLRGASFLEYVYDELAYQIAKKAADDLVAAIIACGTVSTTTCPSVPVLKENLAIGTIANAMAKLSDQAGNPVIMMNKATYASFKNAQYAASYPVDPFEGLPVVFNNTITAYSAATTGVTYAIVGDLGYGALANFPNGQEISFKYDDLTLAASDLVRVIGRQFIAEGVVAPDAFVKVTK